MIHADRCESVYGSEPGTMLDLPVYIAAIEGNGHKILVDTGLSNPEKWSVTNKHLQPAEEQIDGALAHIGWKLTDVDLIINTHLHYDHSGNNLAFPDAQFYISRAEWEFGAAPSNAQCWTYDLDWTGPDLTFLNCTIVDSDDYDVLRGLRVIQTPGHTPGHQSVLVNTAEGVLCVTGDAANLLDNFAIPMHVANFVSPLDAMASLEKIRTLSDRVLVNHEPSITNYQSSGFPVCPDPGSR
ncbi:MULTISPECIES: N-acyl homoserine lactonase family protein [unclassified Rhodococcus (in: high G+C Gram-positive bacteria)]|uniref:N-acyl homoserine lactonase family protein n=1 Tax=unclassified Rhodococcus (in: high G+C Gram-positive bacteria) TaxID=192944 RepID=UPI00138F1A70|nr:MULTISPECIES: N-acyl homoserine lactonase family protein [unclassified Rhodococcus (in: high G+C Gram-positive bacteria)]